jgi:PAS domain S-box-containing protein
VASAGTQPTDTIGDCDRRRRQYVGVRSRFRRRRVVRSLAGQDLQLLERLGACIAIMDATGTVVRWNAHAERVLDCPAANVLGRRWTDILTVDGGEAVGGFEIETLAVQPGGWHGRTRLGVRPDRTVWVSAHVQTLLLNEGDPNPGIAAIFWPSEPPDAQPVDSVPPAQLPKPGPQSSEALRLARLADESLGVDGAARQVLAILAEGWGSDASLIVLQGADDFTVVAGPGTSEAIRASFTGLDPAQSSLASQIREANEPFAIDLGVESTSSDWAERTRSLGLCVLRSAPLWFDGKRIGAVVLLWGAEPANPFDATRMEQIGRFAGLAIGAAGLREALRKDADARAALDRSARVGSVVLAQIDQAIAATDADDRITFLNPAAESMYGIRSEEAVGRLVDEVIVQLDLEGSPVRPEALDEVRAAGYWRGRVIHRPRIGMRTGEHLVVDLSLTVILDDRRKPSGLLSISRLVTPGSESTSAAVALGSLAAATSRARSKHEVAAAALERLCEATSADAGVIATWAPGEQIIEASRGVGEELIKAIRTSNVPPMRAALQRSGVIVPLETIGSFTGADTTAQAFARQGFATGFVVDLRYRDESIGFLALASQRASWARPVDQVVLQLAAQIANALETARLMERLEQGLSQERHLTTQLEALMGLTLLPGGDISEEAVAQLLLERVVSALGAEGGIVCREVADRLNVVASLNMLPAMEQATLSRPPATFSFWKRLLADPGGGAFYQRLSEIPEIATDLKPLAEQGVTSHAVFPIRDGDHLLGAFLCYFIGGTEASEVERRNVEAVGRIVSIAFANVRMRQGLAEAAEHERRLTGELRALQDLTLLGASTDDLKRLAQETIEEVVVATGASGGGYILVDPLSESADLITWVGRASRSWVPSADAPGIPGDWPPLSQLNADTGIWLSQSDDSDEDPEKGGSQAVLPLRVDSKLAGVIHLEWGDQPRDEQFDVHFLEPIARICSISLANFRLRAELLRRAAAQRALGHRLDTLDELTRIGEQASSFEELADRTVSLVREALGATGVAYLLIEPGHHFETHAVAGETGAFRTWLKGVPAKDAPGGSLLLDGATSVLGDFTIGQVNERVMPLAQDTGFRSFGAIPIRTGEELAGALLCLFEQPVASLAVDEAALDSVARIAGIAMANFRLRERLVSSEERYRTLFEESPDALLVSALDGTVLDANEAAVRLYRVNRGEVLGRYLGQLIAADEREMARRRQIVWAQGRGTFRDRGRRPDGSEFPLEVEVRVVDLGGQRRFLHLVRDLSDQERLQRELLQAQKMEAIGQLVAGVAHELNNPLAAIIAFSQLMRSDDRLPDDMKHDAGLLVQEADRTRRIVQNLLDFARARPPERRPTSIRTLVNSVLELQSYALNANQIKVEMEIPAALPEVDLDRAQLQQVLLNLTINAIQAVRSSDRKSPAHLWVTASLVKTRPTAGAARMERAAEEQRVRITVRDDGPGVPESARARLFDPFFTTKQPGEGTGLGLSVSFGIVAAHGGHLWYEPGPAGIGSSFVIELPVMARNPESHQLTSSLGASDAAQGPQPLPGASRRRKGSPHADTTAVAAAPAREASLDEVTASTDGRPTRIPPAPVTVSGEAARPGETPSSGAQIEPPPRPRVLALDDEPAIRSFLGKVLSGAGMECVPFQDGAEALEGVREGRFDVMLIDHRMAGMSGTEFYDAAIAIRPELARRAVFMSGDVVNPDLRGFATQREVRLLAKPFDIDAVVRVVREALTAADPETGGSA